MTDVPLDLLLPSPSAALAAAPLKKILEWKENKFSKLNAPTTNGAELPP